MFFFSYKGSTEINVLYTDFHFNSNSRLCEVELYSQSFPGQDIYKLEQFSSNVLCVCVWHVFTIISQLATYCYSLNCSTEKKNTEI